MGVAVVCGCCRNYFAKSLIYTRREYGDVISLESCSCTLASARENTMLLMK